MADLTYSRGSALRDLIQGLNDYFSSEQISGELPAELTTCIASCIQIHEKGDPSYESRKILDELRDLVARNAARSDVKLPPFLKCLKELREILRPVEVIDHFEDWILRPLLHPYGQTRTTLNDAKDVLLFCLIPPDDSGAQTRIPEILYRLFDIYIRKSKDVLQGRSSIHSLQAAKFTITTLEKVLLDYGDKCPKVNILRFRPAP